MKSNKEIERKWLINKFPSDMAPFEEAKIEQAYISTDPEVRIRKAMYNGKPIAHFLTIKSNGGMVRDEIEVKISKEQYDVLLCMAKYKPIEKDLKKYRLDDGHVLECCNVDPNTDNSFMYAEVEFKDEANANAFDTLPIFDTEVTSDSSYKMKNYWVKTRMMSDKNVSGDKNYEPKDSTSIPNELNDCLDKMGSFGEFIRDQVKSGNVKVVKPEDFNPYHFFDDKDPKDISKFTATEVAMVHQHLDEFGFNEAQLAQIEGIVHNEAERLFSALRPSNSFTWPREEGSCISKVGKFKAGLTKKKAKKMIKKMVEEYLDKFLKSKKLKKKIRKIAVEELCRADLGDDLSDLEERVDDIEEHMNDIDKILDGVESHDCDACEFHDKDSDNDEDGDD